MARKFKNPANGHVETVDFSCSLAALIFGWAYLAICGLWAQALISAFSVIALGVGTGGPGGLVAHVIVGILSALSIQGLLAIKYLRNGWVEVAEDGDPSYIASSPVRLCPSCAGVVMFEAKICKHCRSELPYQPRRY